MANSRRRLIGRVVSDKMDKTVVVAIERRKAHRVYKKVVKSTKKVYAHDESNSIEVGSLVQVVESKPLSKTKRWVVEKVIEDAGGRVLEPILGEVDIHPETPAEPEAVSADGSEPARLESNQEAVGEAEAVSVENGESAVEEATDDSE
jgi:small subunit ribosomal protein S17